MDKKEHVNNKPYAEGNCYTGEDLQVYACKHAIIVGCGYGEGEIDGCKIDGDWDDGNENDCPKFECKTYEEIIKEKDKIIDSIVSKLCNAEDENKRLKELIKE